MIDCFPFIGTIRQPGMDTSYGAASSSKKRKGGILQRMTAAKEELTAESALFKVLLGMYAKGILSAHQFHEIAKAGQEDIDKAHDGFQVVNLQRVAKLQQSNNFGRTIASMMAKECNLPMPMQVHIPMKGLEDGVPCRSMLLPHEMFATFFENDAWTQTILPDESKLRPFWDAFESHPSFQNHPLKSVPNYRDKVIPLGLHGDECPVLGVGKIWCKCVLFFSWFSLMSVAAGQGYQQAHIYTWGVFEKYCIKTQNGVLGTMDTFFALLKWSFQCMFDGTWPTHDWRGFKYPKKSKAGRKAGKPLANWWKACLIQLAGDLDYYSKSPRWSNHNKPCSICKATYNGPLSWRDNRYNSGWQNATLTPATYREHLSPTCPLFELPGLSSLSMAMDWMHCHHLGWLQYLFDSVIHLLVFYLLPDAPMENLVNIGNFLKEHQRTNRCKNPYRMKLDKLTMFQPKKGYPKLRGRAADIAGLHSAMLALWAAHMDPADVHHRRIRLVLQLNCQIQDLLEEYSPAYGYVAVPPEPANQVFQKGLQMASLHNQLLEHYKNEEIQVFNMTTKTHFALHSLQFCKHIHPFLIWCYKGESTMHRIQVLWKSCLTAKHFQVANLAALKERHLLWLQYA